MSDSPEGTSEHAPFPLIFAAPSGAGKTTLAHRLRERRNDVAFSVSATTRPPRAYEADGRDYHFVSEAEFRRMIEAGELLEWAEVHGNLYGTPRRNLREAAQRGMYLLLDIDVQGARNVSQALPEAVSIFVLPPTGTELFNRLARRGSESESVRLRRLANARAELAAASEFDYVIVNREVEAATDVVEAILRAEAYRARHARGLKQRIARTQREIDDCLAQNPHQTQERISQ